MDVNNQLSIKELTDSDYVSLYMADLDEDTFEICQNAELRSDVKNSVDQNVGFAESIRQYIDAFVMPEYVDLLREKLSNEYIIEALSKKSNYSIEYCVKDNANHDKHFEVHVLRAQSGNHKILIGWKCVDQKYQIWKIQQDTIEKIRGFADNQKEILSCLAGIYVSLHHLDLVNDEFYEINSEESVWKNIGLRGKAQEGLYKSNKTQAKPQYEKDLREFQDLKTLPDRMRSENIISREFEGTHFGWCRAHFVAVTRDENHNVLTALYVVQKIDEEKRKEIEYEQAMKLAIKSQNDMFREMVEMQISGMVAVNKTTGKVMAINESARKMLRINDKDIEQIHYRDVLDVMIEDSEFIENQVRGSLHNPGDFMNMNLTVGGSQETIHVLSQTKLAKLSDGTLAYVISLTDISDQKKLEEELLYLSEIDGLTGIYNRASGEKNVENALRQKKCGFFALMDVDNFKGFNDEYGHIMGDQVLQSIADCIKQSFAENDIVMRLGGDEFAVYSSSVESKDQVGKMLEEMTKRIESVSIPNLNTPITLSVGAVFCDENKQRNFDQLYQIADVAMYEMKRKRGSAYIIRDL